MKKRKKGNISLTSNVPDFSIASAAAPFLGDSPVINILVRFLVVCLGMYGSAWTFFSAMDVWPQGSALAVWIALYAAAAVVLYTSSNWPFFLLIPVVPLAVWAYLSFDTLTMGFISLLNQTLQTMTENSPWRFLQFALDPMPATELRWAETHFLVLLFCTLTLGAGFFAVRRPWMPGFLLFTAPFAVLPLYFTLLPDLWAFFALVASWGMMAMLHQPLFRRKKASQKTEKVIRQKNVRQQAALLVAGCVLVSSVLSVWAIPQDSYRRPENLQQMVGAIGNWAQRLFAMQSDLHHLPELRFTGATALEVQCSTKKPLYLRGYAAGEFTGSGWEVLSDSTYEAASPSFSGDKVNPQNLYATYWDDYEQGYTLSVRNISANRNSLYLPGGLVTDISHMDGAWYRQDLYAETHHFWGITEYTAQAVSLPGLSRISLHFADGTVSSWFQPSGEAEGTQALLENYAAFVYEPYTALPEETRETAEEWWRQYMKGNKTIELAEACDILRQVFEDDFQYQYDPPVFPQGKEYLRWFLYDAQAGYCVHYATAGVLLLRALGVPARFAEGYIVTVDDYENGEKTDDGYVKIADDHAHAWVEVYDPSGKSWLPVELTPGFTGTSFWESPSGPAEDTPAPTAAPTEEPQATASPTPKATATPQPETEPTPQPQVSPTPSAQNPQQGNGNGFHLPQWLWPVLAAAVCLILLIGAICLRRKRRLEKQHKLRMQANVNLAVREYWTWTFQMLSLAGAPGWENTDTLEEYVHRICTALPGLEQERLTEACRIGEKAGFSGCALSENQRQSMEEWARYLEQWLKGNMSFWSKLRGKWLLGLF